MLFPDDRSATGLRYAMQRLLVAVCLLLTIANPTGLLVVGAQPAPGRPIRLLRQYFADLNTHRYRAAYALEATCSTEFSISNGPGVSPARIGLPGRGRYLLPKAWSYLRHVKIQRIKRFKTRLLNRLHVIGVHVDGWFTFVYPPPSTHFAGNNERSSGYHRAVVIVRRCNGRWQVDPNWLAEGGPFNWG